MPHRSSGSARQRSRQSPGSGGATNEEYSGELFNLGGAERLTERAIVHDALGVVEVDVEWIMSNHDAYEYLDVSVIDGVVWHTFYFDADTDP
jgi:hypothetical protein